jgi:hypothetical protein
MEIYTGNFANVKKYEAAGYIPVSIARYPLRYYTGLRYSKLAPLDWMLKLPEREYITEYNSRILGALNPSTIVDELNFLSKGKDVVLLCYEKEGDFCHRRLVAKWLENHLSINVPECFSKIKKAEPSLF